MPSSLKSSLTAWKLLALQLPLALTIEALSFSNQTCRYLPGDSGWPSQEAWSELNTTVGGRLIATVPLASICHAPNYNETECAALAELWSFPQTHFPSPSSFMAPYWQNQSCDPFTPVSTPCELGNYLDYAINVSSAADVTAGLRFAQESNIRLVIKNTGHDYLGKSSGRGALGLWTHNLKSLEFLNFSSAGYTGPAIKMGAGIQAFEIYEAAAAQGLRVVGGECSTVGIAGGYTQGGGHSALSSTYGMGADQTLEWEVVTANGTYLIASPTQNADLYWALSGGGGSSYGVVLSLTVKAHQDGVVGGAAFSFNSTGISTDVYWEGVSAFHSSLPGIVDTGAAVVYSITSASVAVSSITSPGSTEAEVTAILQPLLSKLQALNISSTLSITSFPNYLEHFETYLGPLPYGDPLENLMNITMGSRLIPRSMFLNSTSNSAFTAAVKEISNNPEGFACGGVAVNVAHSVAGNTPSTNAVLPAWRDAIVHFLVVGGWNFSAPLSTNHASDDAVANYAIPALEAVSPTPGAYLNEDVFQQADFQDNFYGSNYNRLKAIKKLHDPDDLFYAMTAVGSEAWTSASDGRLCRAGY